MYVLSSAAPYGEGGLGAHLRQMVEETRRQGRELRYYCTGPAPGDPDGAAVDMSGVNRLLGWPPLRFSPGWKAYLFGDAFDWAVSRHLPAPEAVYAFNGQALRTFWQARRKGCPCCILIAATAHVRQVAEQYRRAYLSFPLESPWLNGAQLRKTETEYAPADRILVTSEYAYKTFVDAGIAPERLRLQRLGLDLNRLQPAAGREEGVFRVLYVGSLTVAKGLPVLIEAFHRAALPGAELMLCGGWATRGMRRYLQAWQERDRRIRVAPGDPIPHFHRAHVYVHPSFQDGFGLAPLEAMACGLPVIVTADTGMKEVLAGGQGGFVVPTGSSAPVADLLRTLYEDRPLWERLGRQARVAAVRWVRGEGQGIS